MGIFLRIEQGACLKEPWQKVTRRILTLRLSCVDQVQVDMLCQAHADKLVTISPKIKNLHSHLVNDLVIVSFQKHRVPDQFILSKTKSLDLAKMELPNILNKGEERRLTPSNHQDLADMRITNVIHRVKLIPQNIQWEVEQSTDGVMLSHQPIPTLYHLSLDLESHPSKLQMLTVCRHDERSDHLIKIWHELQVQLGTRQWIRISIRSNRLNTHFWHVDSVREIKHENQDREHITQNM